MIDAVQPIYRTINADGSLGGETTGAKLGGSGGGSPVTIKAPSGSVMTGIDVRVGNDMDAIRIRYSRWNGADGISSSVFVSSWVGNANGGTSFSRPCGANQFVAGLSTTVNPPGPAYVLEGMAIQCARMR